MRWPIVFAPALVSPSCFVFTVHPDKYSKARDVQSCNSRGTSVFLLVHTWRQHWLTNRPSCKQRIRVCTFYWRQRRYWLTCGVVWTGIANAISRACVFTLSVITFESETKPKCWLSPPSILTVYSFWQVFESNSQMVIKIALLNKYYDAVFSRNKRERP